MIQIATPFLGIQLTIQLFSHSLSVWHGGDGVMDPIKAARPLVAKNPRVKSKRPSRAERMAGDSVVGISCGEGLAV